VLFDTPRFVRALEAGLLQLAARGSDTRPAEAPPSAELPGLSPFPARFAVPAVAATWRRPDRACPEASPSGSKRDWLIEP
jgi:hypothetical protein